MLCDGLSKTLLMAESLVAGGDANSGFDGRGEIFNDDRATPGSMFMTINTPNSTVPDAMWCPSGGLANAPCVPAAGTNGQQAARSRHNAGVNALLADGAVRFFSDSVDGTLWQALGTPRDARVVTLE